MEDRTTSSKMDERTCFDMLRTIRIVLLSSTHRINVAHHTGNYQKLEGVQKSLERVTREMRHAIDNLNDGRTD